MRTALASIAFLSWVGAACVLPPPIEQAPGFANQAPRILVETLLPRPSEMPIEMTTDCADGYDFNLSVFDLDDQDSIYWRVFLDFAANRFQAEEFNLAEGEVLPSSANQGRRQVRFTVDAFDARFFSGTSPFAEPHVVEIIVSDRPFSDASPLEGRRPDTAAFPEAQIDLFAWSVALSQNPCGPGGGG